MAWQWSHTAEGMQAARENVLAQPREWLEVVYAEWEAHVSEDDREDWIADNFDEATYDQALSRAKELPADALAESIWERMEEQATCDKGGHRAWCCPYGCECHKVSFDRQ